MFNITLSMQYPIFISLAKMDVGSSQKGHGYPKSEKYELKIVTSDLLGRK